MEQTSKVPWFKKRYWRGFIFVTASASLLLLTQRIYLVQQEKFLCERWFIKGPFLCPELRIVTVEHGGRLGNQMWEYAAVWAVARATGLKPLVPVCLRRRLDKVFANLSIPVITPDVVRNCSPSLRQEPFVTQEEIVNITRRNLTLNRNMVLKRWVVLPELVVPRLKELARTDFRFLDSHLEENQSVLRSLNRSSDNVTYVGVHVRRTDYGSYLKWKINASLAKVDYFHQAMDYFRNKYVDVVFVVVSDDIKWCKKHIWNSPGVFFISRHGVDAPDLDMALLASCNHTIIDYGTYGSWGALLSGGETIVYDLGSQSAYETAKLMSPKWKIFGNNYALQDASTKVNHITTHTTTSLPFT